MNRKDAMPSLPQEQGACFEWFARPPLGVGLACMLLLAALLLGGTAGQASELRTEPQTIRMEISKAAVTEALTEAGIQLEGAEVRLLVRMTTTSPAPHLDVRAVEPWGPAGARIRLGCVKEAACLPFYVAVQWPTAEAARTGMHREAAEGAGSGKVAQAAGVSAVAGKRGSSALQAGARARLVLEGARLHIELPVICLESGSVGGAIRVTGLDHRQTYTAEVVNGTLLKGTL